MTGANEASGFALTVVGSSCSIPRPGRACSSYLFEAGGRAIVADLGSGAFSSLSRYRAVESIDAVLISHMHADHFIDVIPMRYALKYGDNPPSRKPLLYLPPGGEAMLRRLTDAFARESNGDFMAEVFDVRTYDPARTLQIGEAAIRFVPTSHYIPTFAIRCDAAGASVTYSADTAPDDRVVELARNTELFMCECTLTAEAESERPRGHLSAREAGLIARKADARRLLLTHYPATADPADLEAQARAHYPGPIEVADDGLRITV